MDSNKIYKQRRAFLEQKIEFLTDKPEENFDSTLRALWYKAAGYPRSVENSITGPLPELNKEQLATLDNLIEKRMSRIPLAHLTGRQSFMGIELISDTRALIPRKETEFLGQKALELSQVIAKNKSIVKIIDLCCGSGNIGLALAYHNPMAMVYCSDISTDAIDLARENISLHNLETRVKAEAGDLYEALENDSFFGKTDIVVCNPPYISSFKVSKMNPEISEHEPHAAFDGGMIGLRIIQKLICESPRFLVPENGWLLFEVGAGQGEMITGLCERTGLYDTVRSVRDLDGNIRVIILKVRSSDSTQSKSSTTVLKS